MNEWTQTQVGSPSRDAFKRKHKSLGRTLYACDLDFVLVTKVPTPDIIAALDYKQGGDNVSFSEVIAYNALIHRGIPVYIVTGDYEIGQFSIERYDGGHHGKPRFALTTVSETSNWEEFERWERALRADYERRFGQ